MIKKISYQIRFPLGAEFQSDPKYLFLKKIYTSIKKILCLNKKIDKCETCNKKERCLYDYLSGENFEYFPGILVDRNSLEKKKYDKSETFELTFYLIGTASQYVDFITEYFNSTSQLGEHFFQKRLIDLEYIDDQKLYSGKLKSTTTLEDIVEINLCLDYYNQKYNCNYLIPEIKVISKDSYMRDFSHYQINYHKIYLNGYKMVIEIKNYPYIFTKIGIGKHAFLGGGKFNEN